MIKTENKQYIEDIAFENADTFLKAISYGGELYDVFDKKYIFRGHSTTSYKLLPTAQRIQPWERMTIHEESAKRDIAIAITELAQIGYEYNQLFHFFKKCDENGLYVPEVHEMREYINLPNGFPTYLPNEKVWLPEKYYELAALAQHHGVKTRLLDWTKNICVALYFASSEAILRRYNLEKKTSAQWQRQYMTDFLKKVHECADKQYKRTSPVKETDCIELWALDKSIEFGYDDMPLKIISPRNCDNRNLVAQKGLLSLWKTEIPAVTDSNGKMTNSWLKVTADERTLDKLLTDFLLTKNETPKKHLYHVTIPLSEAFPLYNYAVQNGYDASTLFPGYDGVVRAMAEKEAINNKN